MKLKHITRTILLLSNLLFLCNASKAQMPALVPGINELHVGDTVPDIVIDKIINNDKRSIRTSDYKNKLLVLDFWDEYCGTCIEGMPKLDSLQRVFGDKIKLLSVTWQKEDDIARFFKTNKYLNNRKNPVHRPSVVEDRVLRSYFPFQTTPHVVWIYKGKVAAITGYEYIYAKYIQQLLDGETVNWKPKVEDKDFDPRRPFMMLDGLSQGAVESPLYSYSVLTGQSSTVSTIGGDNFVQDTARNRSRVALFNSDIYAAYQILLFNTKPKVKPEDIEKDYTKLPYLPNPARKIFEVKDPSRLEYRPEYGDLAEWNRKNLICYEFEKYGMVDEKEMAKLAIQDLNNRLGLNGRYEKRRVKCLVFVRTNKPVTDTLPKGEGGMSVPAIATMKVGIAQKYPPAIDETGLGFKTELRMQPTDGTIAGLRKEMQRHGLDLIEAEREIEVIVISDAK